MTTLEKEFIKETNKKGLQCLHNCFGYDYNKPYRVYMISGKFTLNQVVKMISVDGFSVTNSKIVICVKDSLSYRREFSAVEMIANDKIDIDFKFYRYGGGLDYFYCKKDFENCRKSDQAITYIFAQRLEFIKKPVEFVPDFTTDRFNYLDCNYTSYHEKSYISSINLKSRNNNGCKCTRNIIGRVFYVSNITSGVYKTDIAGYIDKSGYFVDYKRDGLKRRAAALRAQREKAAFEHTNNGEKINALHDIIQARKTEIIALFQAAETSGDYKRISKIMDLWRGFPDIIDCFERLKARDNKKEYKSILDFETAYNNIIAKIEKNKMEV